MFSCRHRDQEEGVVVGWFLGPDLSANRVEPVELFGRLAPGLFEQVAAPVDSEATTEEEAQQGPVARSCCLRWFRQPTS